MQKVIDMGTQLQYFDEYKKKLQRMVGKKRMEYIINNAAVVISCGTNDIVYTYVPDYLPQQPDKVAAYLHLMLDHNHEFIQVIIYSVLTSNPNESYTKVRQRINFTNKYDEKR